MRKFSENGIAMLLLSSVFFTTMALLARHAMATLPASEVVFFRMLVGALVCLAMFAARVESLDLRRPGVLLVRGALGGIAVFFFFKSISLLSAGEATLLNNTFVVFIAILSPFVLRERVTPKLAALVAAALCGIVLVVGADMGAGVASHAIGLAGALFTSLAVLTIRNLRRDHGSATIFFFFSLGGLICSLSTRCDGWSLPGPASAGVLLAMGLAAAGGQLLFTQALRYTRAIESGIFAQLTVVFTYATEIAFMGLKVTAASAAGAALIIGACVYLNTIIDATPEGPLGN